jgi:hypothetical protein
LREKGKRTVSIGTNVVNLLNTGKKTLLYLGPQGSSFNGRTFEDLYAVLHVSGIDNGPLFLNTLGLGDPGPTVLRDSVRPQKVVTVER